MAILSFCGIDVSKDRMDVVVLPEGRFCSVSNEGLKGRAGSQQWSRSFRGNPRARNTCIGR
jgi:hypothetical protein